MNLNNVRVERDTRGRLRTVKGRKPIPMIIHDHAIGGSDRKRGAWLTLALAAIVGVSAIIVAAIAFPSRQTDAGTGAAFNCNPQTEMMILASGDPDRLECVNVDKFIDQTIQGRIAGGSLLWSNPCETARLAMNRNAGEFRYWTTIPMDSVNRPLIAQTDFACNEDEMLGFAAVDAFEHVKNIDPALASRDYVTCLSTELLKNNFINDAINVCARLGANLTGADADGNPMCAKTPVGVPSASTVIKSPDITGVNVSTLALRCMNAPESIPNASKVCSELDPRLFD